MFNNPLNQPKPWEKVIEQLEEEQVIEYVMSLGSASPIRDSDNNLVFQSICHGSTSRKLCYYTESKNFFCYMEWQSFNIFSLTMVCLNIDFKDAYRHVCEYFGISIYDYSSGITNGFANNYVKQDWDIFEKYAENATKQEEKEEIFNPNLLNIYSELYYEDWIKNHISVKAMKKYDIRYSIADNCIVIPHYNTKKELVGLRGRFLEEDAYGKYMPMLIEGKWYAHALTNHFYGLWENKDIIKRLGKVLIVEGEKSVLQSETYFPDNNFSVAVCGKNISNAHIKLLLSLGVREVQLGMDSDFLEIGDNEAYLLYRKSILKKAKKLIPYFTVYNVGAYDNSSVYYKCSPSDMGKEVLLEMMSHKEWLCDFKIEEELTEIEEKLSKIKETGSWFPPVFTMNNLEGNADGKNDTSVQA